MTRDSSGRIPILVLFLIGALSIGWGLSWPMMKIALSEFPIWTYRAWSCLAAGACLLGLARLSAKLVEHVHRPRVTSFVAIPA